MTDRVGLTSAQHESSVWKVVSAIVLTDELDVKASKVVRRLDADEELQALGERTEDAQSGMKRVRVKCKRDDKEGFVTFVGNQGTVFCEETQRTWKITSKVALQRKFESVGAPMVRQLDVGEKVEVLEGPKAEQLEG